MFMISAATRMPWKCFVCTYSFYANLELLYNNATCVRTKECRVVYSLVCTCRVTQQCVLELIERYKNTVAVAATCNASDSLS